MPMDLHFGSLHGWHCQITYYVTQMDRILFMHLIHICADFCHQLSFEMF
jgi:hypothetical protein